MDSQTRSELLDKLLKEFYLLGLKTQFVKHIDDTLRIKYGDEEYKISSELLKGAFKAAADKQLESEKWAVQFAKDLHLEFSRIAESDSKARRAKGLGDPEGAQRGNNGNAGNGTGTDGGSKHPPLTAEEVAGDLKKFLERTKCRFEYDETVLQDMAGRVAAEGRNIQDEFKLSYKQLIGLAGVSLYDIYFLCDDSGSMGQGERIPLMMKTLQSVGDWACRLEPKGISLRFLNYEEEDRSKFDNLNTVEKIKDRCFLVKGELGFDTQLGTVLQKKILNLRKLMKDDLTKPLIVAIITDGEPTGEDEDCLLKTITKWHTPPGNTNLEDHPPAVFMIFQVGKDKRAREFINDLAAKAGDDLYCSSGASCLDDIAEKLALRLEDSSFDKMKLDECLDTDNVREYKRKLLDEFIRAIRTSNDLDDAEKDASEN